MMRKTNNFFKHFDMKDLGEASHVLGLKIHKDRNKGYFWTFTEDIYR
jgi:hypothetical protein